MAAPGGGARSPARRPALVPALQRDLSDADISGVTWGHARRLTAVGGITAVTVCGLAAGAWALTHRPDDGPQVPTYNSAREMAKQVGCATTFRSVRPPAGVQSAGECTVSGHVVAFRVQRVIDSGDPWPTSTGSERTPNYVGNGWIVHSSDRRTLDAAGARLAP
jgi:hypothetical protein